LGYLGWLLGKQTILKGVNLRLASGVKLSMVTRHDRELVSEGHTENVFLRQWAFLELNLLLLFFLALPITQSDQLWETDPLLRT
jgi:hypothetical protein